MSQSSTKVLKDDQNTHTTGLPNTKKLRKRYKVTPKQRSRKTAILRELGGLQKYGTVKLAKDFKFKNEEEFLSLRQ